MGRVIGEACLIPWHPVVHSNLSHSVTTELNVHHISQVERGTPTGSLAPLTPLPFDEQSGAGAEVLALRAPGLHRLALAGVRGEPSPPNVVVGDDLCLPPFRIFRRMCPSLGGLDALARHLDRERPVRLLNGVQGSADLVTKWASHYVF